MKVCLECIHAQLFVAEVEECEALRIIILDSKSEVVRCSHWLELECSLKVSGELNYLILDFC